MCELHVQQMNVAVFYFLYYKENEYLIDS